MINRWHTSNQYTVRVLAIVDRTAATRSIKSVHTSSRNRRLELLVEYGNIGKKPHGTTTHPWSLVTADGQRHMQKSLYERWPRWIRELQWTAVKPYQPVRGYVAFEVPPDAAEIVAVYFQPPSLRVPIVIDVTDTVNDDLPPLVTLKQHAQSRDVLSTNWQTRLMQLFSPGSLTESGTLAQDTYFELGHTYQLIKPIHDVFGRVHVPDTQLTFIKRYPPYRGLHILIFDELTIHLNDRQHAEVLGDLDRYFEQLPMQKKQAKG